MITEQELFKLARVEEEVSEVEDPATKKTKFRELVDKVIDTGKNAGGVAIGGVAAVDKLWKPGQPLTMEKNTL